MTNVVRPVGVQYEAEARSRQESEARLRLFLERTPAAVAMFDTEMRYLAYTHRYLTDFGLGGCAPMERSFPSRRRFRK